MDYFQGVVADYLRADRALFLNTECCLQLNPGENPDVSGPHWYCDIVAADFRAKSVYLCEVTYSKSLASMLTRLRGWATNWNALQAAVRRDCAVPEGWPFRAWVFVPEICVPRAVAAFSAYGGSAAPEKMPSPRITPLEMVTPWRYRNWNRVGEAEKPENIPPSMR